MLTSDDKKYIANVISAALVEFKAKNLSFRARRTVDTSVDFNQTANVGDLSNYVPKGGADLDDGANIGVGSGVGTKIATAPTQKLGFWGATPVIRQTATGSRGANAALASLLTALATEGLITDSTTI